MLGLGDVADRLQRAQLAFLVQFTTLAQHGPSLIAWFGFANAFYCLGPLLDIYAHVVLGVCLSPDRYLLFASGLSFFWRWVLFLGRLFPLYRVLDSGMVNRNAELALRLAGALSVKDTFNALYEL